MIGSPVGGAVRLGLCTDWGTVGWPAGSQGRVRLPPDWLPSHAQVFTGISGLWLCQFSLCSQGMGVTSVRSQSLDTSARSIFPEAGAVVLQLTRNVTE